MKKRRKRAKCLNCDYKLEEVHNYCPMCGQENTDFRVSIWDLIVEFFGSYMNFDSRLGRSIVPFLFKPGFLTNEFNLGKRTKYVHPVRFYFVITFLFFLVFSQVVGDVNFEDENSPKSVPDSTFVDKNVTIGWDADKIGVFSEEDSAELAKLAKDLKMDSTLTKLGASNFVDTLKKKERNVDKLKNFADSLNKNNPKTKENFTNWNMMGVSYKINLDKIDSWLKDPKMTSDILLDSIKASEKNFLNRRIAQQAIKMKGEPEELYRAILDNFPTAIFFLMPVFAFILKIFYIRSKRLFIEHLVLAFHLHAFIFFALFIPLLLNLWLDVEELWGWCSLIIVIYTFFMLKNVYGQGKFKTTFKFFSIIFTYFITLIFAAFFEVLLSIMLF
jgi:hypothetical protein